MSERLDFYRTVAWAVLTAPLGYIRDEIAYRRIGKAAIHHE